MNVQPQFRTVVRGFDPDQVNDTVKSMYTALTIARRAAADNTLALASAQEEVEHLRVELAAARSEAAETAAAASAHGYSEVGERIGTMLRLAEEEATQLRQASERDARQLREAADADAMRMRSAAQASADDIIHHATEVAAARRDEADHLYQERQTLLDRAQDDIQQQLEERAAQAEALLAEERARHEARVAELRTESEALAAHADEVRQSARDEAAGILAQAREEADQLRMGAEAGLVELKEDHHRIRHHLDRLHRVLGELLEQTPESGVRGSSPGHNGANESASHPSPTDLPGHGRWFLERVSPPADVAHPAGGVWEDVFDRREQS